ncbi:MAG: PrgI family protein, partial [Clostridiales bacterium]
YELKWNSDLVGWLAILVGIPLFSIGFFNYRGMSMEKFIFQLVKTNFLYPTRRLYRKKNIMEEYLDDLEKEKNQTKKR